MKKASILFLVLAIIFTCCACTATTTREETTTSSELSSEGIQLLFNWIDRVFEEKQSTSYGGEGCRPSNAEVAKNRLDEKILSIQPDERPAFYSIEYLPHPEDTEGYFQIKISFEATAINREILSIIENNSPKAHLFINGYSKNQIESIN